MSGPFGSSQWMYASGGFYNGVATQSLRFDDGSSAYLTRTPSSAGNRKTWTISTWIKRSGLGVTQGIFSAKQTKDDTTALIIGTGDQLLFTDRPSDVRNINLTTNRLFRDVGAWYHIVIKVDTTEATSSDRVKIYINGVQETSFSTSSYPTQNYDTAYWNNTNEHRIGMFQDNSALHFDGYTSEFNFVDGSALDPTSFGEFKNGVWIAKEYTGSYGTNGFRLQFNQTGTGTASSSTIGADTSGNANHFSSSGIVASDCDMPDSPENNFCTNNSVAPDTTGSTNHSFSEGNLKVSTSTDDWWNTFGTIGLPFSGKYYWEYRAIGSGSVDQNVGIVTTDWYRGSSGGIDTADAYSLYASGGTGYLYTDGSNVNKGSGWFWTWGDIVNFAFDADTGKVWYGINGTWLGSGNPATGTNEAQTVNSTDLAKGMLPAFSGYWTGGTPVMNFGQDSTFAGATTAGGNTDANGKGDFKYSVPSGYLALCTANLPEPTISPNADTQAENYFNTVTWSGDNTSPRSITGWGFQPDWMWSKARNKAYYHWIYDSVRGAGSGKGLGSSTTLAEGGQGDATYGYISSFDSDGFTATSGTTNNSDHNETGTNYVGWGWKAGGTAVSNTDGTITSTVSANTDAGFSIITYTGNATAGATVGHGLGVKPDFMIFKSRGAVGSWYVYHKDLTAENSIYLNLTNGSTDQLSSYNDTEPTDSVITFGDGSGTNPTSITMVGYIFAEIEGYSKFGSYIGNGSAGADSPFIYLGFRPAFVLFKNATTTATNWQMNDSVRDTFNVVNKRLAPSTSDAESSSTYQFGDFLSNGFKIRETDDTWNKSGATYIYMAFAENPFKYANAR